MENSRILKFRAWDIKNKKMIEDATVLFHYDWTDPFTDEDYICLQFTGLRDSKGIDVFEGDILACPYVDPMGRLHEKDIDKEKSGVVVFEQGLFGIKYQHHVEELKSWCKRTEGEYVGNYGCPKIYENNIYCEVLGNSFQHPELLGDK